MKWWIYNGLFAVGYTLLLPKFAVRMWRRGGYRRGFLQRFGVYGGLVERLAARRRIWIHAVSVGEIQVAFGFMAAMRKAIPGVAFVITTTTSTAHQLAEKQVAGDDVLLYFPADFPWIIRRVLAQVKPLALILTESELWPNLIRMLGGRGVPVFMINGRISETSFRGYRWVRSFFADVLKGFTLLLVQGAGDRDRLVALGAPAERVQVMGSAKYDLGEFSAWQTEKVARVLETVGIEPKHDTILVGGSTWPGEEDVLVSIYRRLKPKYKALRLVLVPRHAERRAEVEEQIKRQHVSYVRRSVLHDTDLPGRHPADMLLVDTTGELRDFYACADIVFVGKSLTEHGGQNLIEPAALGRAVVVGPNMENFAMVMPDFLATRACWQVADATELERAIEQLLADRELREAYGERAHQLVEQHRGVIERSVGLIRERLPGVG